MQEDSLHIDDAINTFVHVHRAITRDQIMKRVNKKCKELTSAPPKKRSPKKRPAPSQEPQQPAAPQTVVDLLSPSESDDSDTMDY